MKKSWTAPGRRDGKFALSVLFCAGLAFSGVAPAQQAPVPATKLVTLGTVAGPFPMKNRAQNSNLIVVNGQSYVFDAGDGAARRLGQAEIPLRNIGTIFITHHHDDHTAGLGTLMSVAWDSKRTDPINVYGPVGTKALVDAAIQYAMPSAALRIEDGGRSMPIEKVFHGHDVKPGLAYEDGNVKVYAAENTHFDFHKNQTGYEQSFSYRIETPDRVIAITSDTSPNPETERLAQGADYLVAELNSVEARKQILIDSGQWARHTPEEKEKIMVQASHGHLSPKDVGELATRAKVKTVVLTHLTPKFNSDDYTAEALEVRKYYDGPVIVARDLDTFF
ncbi:MAG: MBL fold metallo-hydrolase [Castellaniella sp.]|uniref:MBL fold metallo-hydrolase n=1 Tax=Castellaniella sp. TaxID=1955812 RepID=UPI003C768FC8